jgi:hypothetical protein
MQSFKRDYGFTVQPMANLLKAPQERRKRERETVAGVEVDKGTRGIVSRLTGE